MPKNDESSAAVSRRRFVQGLAVATFTTGALWRPAARAQSNGGSPPVLSGREFKLVIDRLPFNVTGRRRMATAINGSIPGPILRIREGDTVRIHVTNALAHPEQRTSIHWHGMRLPADMDGVPGLSFPGISPGETFTYHFPIVQGGTYWYHSHSLMQEQTGLYGALVLVPREPEPYAYQRDYVVQLSDWTDEDPMQVLANLKQQSDYYNFHRRTLGTFIHDIEHEGFKATVKDRLMWGSMRMSPTDIMDVTGATYTFLVNGHSPAANWTALFKPGEKVRLRLINSASMTTFDVRIPGLQMTVVAADGSDVEPVRVDELRIGVAETYDVIVEPPTADAYTLFAQAEDRSGYARATLAPRLGMAAAIPPMDPRPVRTMTDMGMGGMAGMKGMADMKDMPDMKSMPGMKNMPGMDMSHMNMPNMPGMKQGAAQKAPLFPAAPVIVNADGVDMKQVGDDPWVDNIAMQPHDRLGEAGDGLDGNGRRNLVYTDLRAIHPDTEARAPDRDIVFHLTGNMQRFVWGFDGKKFSEVGPVHVKLGERVRFVLINDTMMEHPIHLHGFLFSLENGRTGQLPLKHTVNVKPAGVVSFVFTADTPGHWAFHCHLLYHMEAGMFRTVLVA